jgi:hypothetical protein
LKPPDFSRFFNPLFLLVMGLLGVLICTGFFSAFFALDCQEPINAYFCTQRFSIWFFLMAFMWCLITTFFIPGWGMFIWLYRRLMSETARPARIWETLKLLSVALIVGGSATTISPQVIGLFYPALGLQWIAIVSGGIQTIIYITTFCYLAAALPYLLGMFTVNLITRGLTRKLRSTPSVQKSVSFVTINELITFHWMLQVLLTIGGVLLSIIAPATIAFRSILVQIGPASFQDIFPVTLDVAWGVLFTLLLLIIYTPARFELSIVGHQVRDVLVPVRSINGLKDTLENRKALEDLLHTEFNFTSVLSGIVTLLPLAAGLLSFVSQAAFFGPAGR